MIMIMIVLMMMVTMAVVVAMMRAAVVARPMVVPSYIIAHQTLVNIQRLAFSRAVLVARWPPACNYYLLVSVHGVVEGRQLV